SSCASVCPAVTCWPTWTGIDDTWPDTGKVSVALLTGWIVPEVSSVAVTEAGPAITVRYPPDDEPEDAHTTAPPPARTTTSATRSTRRRRLVRAIRSRAPLLGTPSRRAAVRPRLADGDRLRGDRAGVVGLAGRRNALADLERGRGRGLELRVGRGVVHSDLNVGG